MKKFTTLNCSKEKQEGRPGTFSVEFHEAYTPYVILGDTSKGKDLTRKSFVEKEKGSDLK